MSPGLPTPCYHLVVPLSLSLPRSMSPSDNPRRGPQTDITSLGGQQMSRSPNPKLPPQERFLRERVGPGVANEAPAGCESQSAAVGWKLPFLLLSICQSYLTFLSFIFAVALFGGFTPFTKRVWVLKSHHGKQHAHTHTPQAFFPPFLHKQVLL